MNLSIPLSPNCVIPAQAGIQMINKSPAKRGNIAFVRFAEYLSLLDSCLRGNDKLMDYVT